MQIVGIDCAADPKNVGYAFSRDRTVLAVGAGDPDPGGRIVELVDWGRPVLLAMDAPLGWPRAMGAELPDHQPGGLIRTPPDFFFRRRTDHVVRAAIGKPVLEVGAALIARAAHGALRLIHEIRRRSGVALPVFLDPWTGPKTGIVEVYPAGTLKASGYPFTRYKAKTTEASGVDPVWWTGERLGFKRH